MAEQQSAAHVDERTARRMRRQALIDAGINPYPIKSEVTAHAAELEERYAKEKAQEEDLLAAKAQILSLIDNLNLTSGEMFKKTFEQANANFQQMFTKLFNEMLHPQNREQEPWALKALQLLSSDVYEPVNNALIEPGLQSLQYIQQTSDIFFPTSWLRAMLGSHKSKEARLIVEQFISTHPAYPEHLRNKIFEAAWFLMKQQPYVAKAKPTPAKKAPAKAVSKAPAKKAPARKK